MTAAPVPAWVHPATYVEPTPRQRPDGDTFRLRLDLGTYAGNVRIDPVITIRLAGIDVVELRSPTGPAARDFTRDRLRGATSIIVATNKPDPADTLARTPARVWVDGLELADLLRDAGYAKAAGEERLG